MTSEDTIGVPTRPGPAARISLPRSYVSPTMLRFLANEAGSAVLLLAATVAAVAWANIPGARYEAFWSTQTLFRVGTWSTSLDLRHWVNDAAMAVFFLVVGLEISREVTVGELRNRRTVVVPALGAVGGLVLPALLYLAFEHSGPATTGWGIPMSTDTAFLIGILALFGPRCPDQLRLFLLTLAIVDDIGAIVVMAFFYTPKVSAPALVAVLVLFLALAFLRWARVWQLQPYILVGLALWCAVYASGLHPTLAGVLIGLLVPAARVDVAQGDRVRFYGKAAIERADPVTARLAAAAARATVPANDRLQNALHPVSAFVVVPVFGLANAGVLLNGHALRSAATSGMTMGVIVGLLAGNAIGISAMTWVALRSGLGDLPGRVRYGHLLGGAVLAGIGFTISLFITDLALTDEVLRRDAKIGVLAGSVLAAALGSVLLRYLGERLPLCSIDEVEPPALPTGPWLDPTLLPG
ncbi:Na+/H+ antiporter NhaA [Jatrophihabitans lederbergiae]|uniref:Na(+)/H(+) antiporter NhaA n=1 Tax=Jatrophihabitans lederbergiae TaxID=3075547 RepID=A0ABU2J9L8_9ACTN|nr:Na+/H+ antiporter NhaA [Jatrophihabitans sp. DSM 44399]MDT0261686.1 Na+/H+ antiporter NhaA [Jatrophihabitans sp. DSM 44399]